MNRKKYRTQYKEKAITLSEEKTTLLLRLEN